ncbi:thymidine phosphorylase [Pseudoxanthomonas sp. CAU 1598]|uniref:thymidine phosphorylase n=2 Tax=Pseudomarimonas arenosa TaxID=2774145 RepID=A0AAW3ZJN2_9GAMM|nr:thymidine phosphorylase [Pseudomarimonas arenosa]MBD8526201.1 thymidine phosphorylase [Pseudomarimonas arenosa]
MGSATALSIPAFLARKRHDKSWSAESLRVFARAIAAGQVADAQLGAFAMAVCCRGMDEAELLAWTEAVRDSGQVLRWPRLADRGPVLDKHSTGGVGDCVSLILAPLLAACGGFVPMLSGRGLGHTGGTLDKLSVLPGYRLDVDRTTLQRVVEQTGMAIVAAGADLAPADRRLYAVRDVSATVECLPLIVASILGKKLAVGSSALLLDVKTGSGANLGAADQVQALASGLVRVASRAGQPCRALLSDMSQPLAPAVGNALELALCLEYLQGRCRPKRLHALVLALGSELLQMGGLAHSAAEAEAGLLAALDSGRGAECFARSVAALGGPNDVFKWASQGIEQAPVRRDWRVASDGVVTALDAQLIGLAAVALGAGRQHPEQAIDVRVGVELALEVGDQVRAGQRLGCVHARTEAEAEQAIQQLDRALSIGEQATRPTLISGRIDGAGSAASRYADGVAA